MIERGHKVVVLTNIYKGERVGIRYLTNGIKVYYTPVLPIVNQSSIYYMHFSISLIRNIVDREQINLIHGH